MAAQIAPLMMFEGQAEAAMTFYVSLFDDAVVTRIERYGAEGPGAEGSVKHAAFTLLGREHMCMDSPIHHAFSFTPSLSLFVTCAEEAQQARLYEALSEGGEVLMALDAYGFSRRFGWVNDRFGVSWQLNLPFA